MTREKLNVPRVERTGFSGYNKSLEDVWSELETEPAPEAQVVVMPSLYTHTQERLSEEHSENIGRMRAAAVAPKATMVSNCANPRTRLALGSFSRTSPR